MLRFIVEGLISYADSGFWLVAGVLSVMLLSGFGLMPLDAEKIRDAGTIDVVLTRVRRISLLWLFVFFLPAPWMAAYLMCGLYGESFPESCVSARVWRDAMYWSLAFPLVTAVAFALLLSFAIRRYVITTWSSWLRKWRYRVSDDKLSDIRSLAGKIKVKAYDPTKYYQTKGWDQIFVGLGSDGAPKYIDTKTLRGTHMEVIGPSGCGKGVVIGAILDQIIRMKDAKDRGSVVIAIMPKQDLWLPHVMQQSAKAAGCKFRFFDMGNRAKGGGWAPLAAGDAREKRTRLMAMLGMAESGSDADFYKLGEKRILDNILDKKDFGLVDLNMALEKAAKANKGAAAIRAMDTLAEYSMIDTFSVSAEDAGLRIMDVLEGDRPEVIYVNSSLTDETVLKMTRALILELTQQAMSLKVKGRRKTHVTLFIDELRYLVSEAFDKALATVAMYDMHVIMAYQSATDVEKVGDRNLNGRAIAHSIHTNAQIKLLYRVGDEDQARWAASQTGTQYKTVTGREEVQVDPLGSEKWGGKLMVERKEEYFYPENLFKALPERAGVLIVPAKRAELLFTAHVPVQQTTRFYDDVMNDETRTGEDGGDDISVERAHGDDEGFEQDDKDGSDMIDQEARRVRGKDREDEGSGSERRFNRIEGISMERKVTSLKKSNEVANRIEVPVMRPELGVEEAAEEGKRPKSGGDDDKGAAKDDRGRKGGRPRSGVQRGVH